MAEELDIFEDTTAWQWDPGNEVNPYGIDLGDLYEDRPPPVIEGDDGQMYRQSSYLTQNGWVAEPDYSAPVYFFHQPIEAGDAREIYAEYSDDLKSATQQGQWFTEEEIKQFWTGEGEEGQLNMNVFREQHPDMDFETYMSFIKENSALHQQGFTLEDNPDEFAAIVDKYGIKTFFQGETGHIYGWNGSSYVKTYHQDKSFDFGKVIMGLGLSVIAGPIAGVLSSVMSPTLANVIAQAAVGAMQGRGLSVQDALAFAFNSLAPGSGEAFDPDIQQIIIDQMTDIINNPDNYIGTDDDGNVTIVWDTHGGTDEIGNPVINLPGDPLEDEDDGGGGAPEDPSADADNDGVPASQDPDDNNPDVPSQDSGEIINDTGEDVSTDGEEVEDDGTPVGLEYRWKYIGDGCFVQIDENGQEIPDTKVCDPDYTEEDYELYEVGGIFGRGTDAPFGTPEGDEEDDTTPADEPPAAGTQTEDCLPNGDKIIYTADGEGNWETQVIAGGCLDPEVEGEEEDEDDDGITLGGSPVWDSGDDSGDDVTLGGDDTGAGDDDSGDSDDDSDGEDGAGEDGDGDDGVGDDGTGEGDGGDGEGDGNGDGKGEVSLGGGMMGKPVSFQGMMAGLSYEPQPIPGIRPTPQIDYAADLEELIARQLKNRGMFT